MTNKPVATVALLAAAVIASPCLAFNTPAMDGMRTSGTRLYDAYDDQYANFYNGGPPGKQPEQVQDEQPMTFQEPSAPSAFGSYLDNLGDSNGAPAAEETEQVYYEATNSFAPPEPVVAEPEPIPEPVATFTPPPPLVSQRAAPLQYDSSPTLSAESPTISVTLPVALRPPKLKKAKDISYGEASRKFRRTVYSHDDWVDHRSPDRFIKYLFAIPTSAIYKSLSREVVSVVAVTMMVMIYNGCVTGYQDLSGAYHDPIWSSSLLPPLTLPLQPFTLTSSSLGLLLGTCLRRFRWDSLCHEFLSFLSCPVRAHFKLFLSFRLIFMTFSLPIEHCVPAMGRSPKELGKEHQPHPQLEPNGKRILRPHWHLG